MLKGFSKVICFYVEFIRNMSQGTVFPTRMCAPNDDSDQPAHLCSLISFCRASGILRQILKTLISQTELSLCWL